MSKKIYFLCAAYFASSLVFLNLVDWFPLKVAAFGILILAPGTLFSYLVKIPRLVLWPIRVAFSLIMFMILGLALNTFLPYFGIYTPLRLVFLFPTITLATLLLAWLAGRYGTKELQPKRPKKVSVKVCIVIGLYLLMLACAVFGAFRLNNGAGNQLTMLSLAGLALLNFVILFIFKDDEKRFYPFTLYMSGLTLLLMYSLRSNYVVGWDIQSELHVFNLTVANQRWLLSKDYDAYNATLSLTILPTIFKEFLHVSGDTIYKLFYPFLTATLGPIVYAIARKFVAKIEAFLVALFFIIQLEFMQGLPALERQSIAFIFFMLLLYYILDNSLTDRIKKGFILVLGLAMVVSHYSTAYVGVVALIIAYPFFHIIASRINISKKEKSYSFLSWRILLILLLGTFFWYGQVTNASGGVVKAFETSFKNLVTANTQEQKSVSAQEAVFGSSKSNTTQVQDYNKNFIETSLSKRDRALGMASLISPTNSKEIPTRTGILAKLLNAFAIVAQKIFKLFLIIGVLWVVVRIVRKVKIRAEDAAMYAIGLSFFLMLLAITLIPSLSLFYNIERFYQQTLPVLGIIIILGATKFLKYILPKMRYVYAVIGVLMIGYFLSYTGFFTQIIGGDPSMQLANLGTAYDEYYKHEGEVLSGYWLAQTKTPKQSITTDVYGSTKLMLYYNSNAPITNNILLHILDKKTYVYATYANLRSDIELEKYNNQTIIFSYPSGMINAQKSLLYTNGDSSIYR